jgi:hypothetical protein
MESKICMICIEQKPSSVAADHAIAFLLPRWDSDVEKSGWIYSKQMLCSHLILLSRAMSAPMSLLSRNYAAEWHLRRFFLDENMLIYSQYILLFELWAIQMELKQGEGVEFESFPAVWWSVSWQPQRRTKETVWLANQQTTHETWAPTTWYVLNPTNNDDPLKWSVSKLVDWPGNKQCYNPCALKWAKTRFPITSTQPLLKYLLCQPYDLP